jgi:beta-N-acetylhexosaminidase
MKKFIFFGVCTLLTTSSFSQTTSDNRARAWADSVFRTLTEDERIAQLMIVRLTSIGSGGVVWYDDKVQDLVKRFNVGGICLFQGNLVKQATIMNKLQKMAKTPIMVSIDGEWGVGMRFEGVKPLPRQMMMGAVQDASLIYKYGQVVADQCKRMGIHVNYAPVVDVNNNPNNPVINDRSFGEDKYKVALFGVQYMKGMQDNGVMACAKHFPGHGDVSVDSHYDLPIIKKTRAQLDSLELHPFREIFRAGVSSVMIAHLYIPVIDNRPNRATSISKNNVTTLMREELGYQGLTFTDALEMQGVRKFFPGGEAAVQSLVAGNDMLCLPEDVPATIAKIKEAINKKQLTWDDINVKCKRVLEAKYNYGITHYQPVDTTNLLNDLNKDVNPTRRMIAENAITLLSRNSNSFFPLHEGKRRKGEIAYVAVGLSAENAFSKRMRADYNADVFFFNYKQDGGRLPSTVELIRKRYKHVVIGVHALGRAPANNFGLSATAISLVNQLQQTDAITFVFGNSYAVKNFCDAKNLVLAYEDEEIAQMTAIDLLQGKLPFKGKLPVTVCKEFTFGSGISTATSHLPEKKTSEVGFKESLTATIDSIANDAIASKATPGCVVLVVKDGNIAFHKAYGFTSYDQQEAITKESIYDLASVTKICATTISIMKLYDEGKLDLDKTLGDYLPWVRGTDKAPLSIRKILLHEAGLVSFIPFYRETIDSTTKLPLPAFYSKTPGGLFTARVGDDLYLRKDWQDTIYQRILQSRLGPADKYVYSDNDFIFLGKIVEAISGEALDNYVKRNFYDRLGLSSIGFKPRERFTLNRLVPTEDEPQFRFQQIRGDVHDPGAAMFGGVAGHAGLFGSAYDLAVLMQMLLNGGSFNGQVFFKPETVKLFTSYQSNISRRGLGFDKPEKDNLTRKEPYPGTLVSPSTFGHTGFTGTCVWADPEKNLIYIFLGSRLYPNGGEPNRFLKMNVRRNIHDAIYYALQD